MSAQFKAEIADMVNAAMPPFKQSYDEALRRAITEATSYSTLELALTSAFLDGVEFATNREDRRREIMRLINKGDGL